MLLAGSFYVPGCGEVGLYQAANQLECFYEVESEIRMPGDTSLNDLSAEVEAVPESGKQLPCQDCGTSWNDQWVEVEVAPESKKR